MPPDLLQAIRRLLKQGRVQHPGDARELKQVLAHPEHCDPGTATAWLAGVVKRGGARYDDNNPAHKGPSRWPLQTA